MPCRAIRLNSSSRRSSTRLRDGTVAPRGGLHAQPSQVGVSGVPLRHGGIGQGVAKVRGQVEGALLGDL